MVIRRDEVKPFDFGGLKISDYTAGLPGSSSLAVVHVVPGASHREAWSRRSDKYYYVLVGQVEFTLDGLIYQLSVGDLCVVLQGQRFSYRNVATESASLLLVHTPSFDVDAEVFVSD